MTIKEPKISNLSPKEKALNFLSSKSKEDAIKEVTQLLYLSEENSIAKNYWESVLGYVEAHVVKKQPWTIG